MTDGEIPLAVLTIEKQTSRFSASSSFLGPSFFFSIHITQPCFLLLSAWMLPLRFWSLSLSANVNKLMSRPLRSRGRNIDFRRTSYLHRENGDFSCQPSAFVVACHWSFEQDLSWCCLGLSQIYEVLSHIPLLSD